jgi:hypothetical protein
MFDFHAVEAKHIFTNNPTGLDFFNNTEHFRPEVAAVLCSLSFSGH